MPNTRSELEELRRLEELEAKSSGNPGAYKPKYPTDIQFDQHLVGGGMYGPPLPFSFYNDKEVQAAKEGVDIDTKAPGGIKAGFAATPQEQVYARVKALEEQLGYTPQIRIGPTSGQVEYQMKGSNRWIATGEAFPTSDILTGVGSTIGSAIGGIGGSVAGPGGAATGGFGGALVGAGLGRGGANQLGKAVGALPPDTPVNTGVGQAVEDATVGELMGFGMLATGKGLKWMFRGSKPFAAEEASELLTTMRKSDELLKEIEAGSGQRFQPTAAQLALDKDSGIQASRAANRAGVAQGFAESQPGIGEELVLLQRQNEQALSKYFDTIMAQYTSEQAKQSGGKVSGALLEPYTVARKAALEAIQQLPPDASPETAAAIIRESVESAKKAYDSTVVRPAWEAYRQSAGVNPSTASSNIKVPWSDDVKALYKQWRLEKRVQKKEMGAVPEAKAPALRIPGNKKSSILGPDGKPLAIETGSPTVDLNTLVNRIQELRDDVRAGLSGEIGVRKDIKKYKDLERALVGMRDDYLEKNAPEVKNTLDAAETATRMSYDKFGRGIARDMLTFGKDGTLRFNDGQTLQTLLKQKDLPSVREFAETIKAYPQAKEQVNQLLLALYRRDYTSNGVPTAAKHSRFLKDYGNIITEFFAPEQRSKVLSMGGLAEVVGDEFRQLRKMLPGMRGSLGGEVETIAPEEVINRVLSGNWKSGQLKAAFTTLKDYPHKHEVYAQWRAGVADQMYSLLLDKQGNINFSRVDALLAGDNAEKVKILFNTAGDNAGEKLIKGLENLRDAKRLVETKSIGGLAPHMATDLSDLARITYARPLSREGVMVTALQRRRRRAAPEAIYKALTDPAEMERLSKQVSNLKKQIIGASVGGSFNTYDSTD